MVRGRILTPQIDSRSLMSEELLMLAVLEQAFSDLESGCPAVRADAEAYFLAYDADSSAFSLDSVCAQFRLSASAIRGEVRRRLKQRPIAKAARRSARRPDDAPPARGRLGRRRSRRGRIGRHGQALAPQRREPLAQRLAACRCCR